jgi:S1-C subfamily serine protease
MNSDNKSFYPLAIIAFIVALVGIPLVGLITGAVAMALGGIALGQMMTRNLRQGRFFAYGAMIVGIFDVTLWTALIVFVAPHYEWFSGRQFDQVNFKSSISVGDAPKPIREALEANVSFAVENRGWSFLGKDTYTGSGIIIGKSESDVVVLTNRHVVDPNYILGRKSAPSESLITACFLDGVKKTGYIWWVDPEGADLAIVATGADPEQIPLAVSSDKEINIGDKVFAVGNPEELNWSYTEGVISAVRETSAGSDVLTIYQTQTPINQGNSGGGLYNQEGDLIGIVTWTKDKSQSEGISFAISYSDFLKFYNKSGK